MAKAGGAKKTNELIAVSRLWLNIGYNLHRQRSVLPLTLDVIERLMSKRKDVTELKESGIVLKERQACVRRMDQPRHVLEGRCHDGSERARILSDLDTKSLPRPPSRPVRPRSSAGKQL